MAKISINDWQTIQSRKEIQGIRRIIRDEKTVNWSILIELFLLTVAFCLENIFCDSDKVNALWVVLAIASFIIPTIFLSIMQIYHHHKMENLKQVRDTHELINMFDDELCYYVMTAGSFYDSKIESTIPPQQDGVQGTPVTNRNDNSQPDVDTPAENRNDNSQPDVDTPAANENNTLPPFELQRFYYIEASYYLNKSVNILCLMKNNIINLIESPKNPGSSYGRMITYFRFQNVISLISMIYKDMKIVLDNQTEFASILRNNSLYIERLNDFIKECNRVLGVTLPEIC